jgi:chemotaxis response regulator CheB
VTYRETEHLRVLIANERKDRLALVAPIVVALGHEVIAREVDVEDVGAVTARERPDVALVGLGESSEHALGLIETIVQEAACPVIVLIHARDPDFVKEASKRASSPTSQTPTSRTGRALSISPCAASPNTTTSKVRSDDAR